MTAWRRIHMGWAGAGAVALGLGAGITPCRSAQPLKDLLACRDLSDAGARLACFDREAKALAGSSEPPPASTVPPAASVLDPQQQFGLPEHAVLEHEVAAGQRAPDAVKIMAHIQKYAPAADGHMIFALDNDQVWRQLLADGDILAKAGDEATISRGFLGSYWLQLKSGRGCKVVRLR